MIKQEKHLVDEKELEAIKRVLYSGKFFRHHSEEGECKNFEREFCKKISAENAYLLTSGTNALVAALKSSGIGPGDEVLIPAYTFVATALSVLNVGAIPVITNIDDKLGMCSIDVKSKITEKTKAIIPVHMDGIAANILEISKLATDHKLILIEDVAQAMGSKFNGRFLGTFGDYGCYSLNEDKLLTAGEGGIVVCKSSLNYEKIKCIADGGFPFGNEQVNSLKEITPFAGDSMRVSEITGAMARVQLEKMDKLVSLYRERKNILIEMLKNSGKIELLEIHNPGEDNSVKIHFTFSNPLIAQEVGKNLRKNGIMVYPPFLRRAHLAWQWMDILGERADIDPRRNPYHKSEKNYIYQKDHFKKSINIIMKVLILDIDISMNIDETKELGKKILKILG